MSLRPITIPKHTKSCVQWPNPNQNDKTREKASTIAVKLRKISRLHSATLRQKAASEALPITRMQKLLKQLINKFVAQQTKEVQNQLAFRPQRMKMRVMMPGHRLTGPKKCFTLARAPPTMCKYLTKNGQTHSLCSNLSALEELIIWKRRHLSLSSRVSSMRSYLRFEHARIQENSSAKASWPSRSPHLITRVRLLRTMMSSLRTMEQHLMTARTVINW